MQGLGLRLNKKISFNKNGPALMRDHFYLILKNHRPGRFDVMSALPDCFSPQRHKDTNRPGGRLGKSSFPFIFS